MRVGAETTVSGNRFGQSSSTALRGQASSGHRFVRLFPGLACCREAAGQGADGELAERDGDDVEHVPHPPTQRRTSTEAGNSQLLAFTGMRIGECLSLRRDDVLNGGRTGKRLRHNSWKRWKFDPAVKAAKPDGVTSHDLRATHGSWGADKHGVMAAAKRLGHSNANVTTRHCARAVDGRGRRDRGRLRRPVGAAGSHGHRRSGRRCRTWIARRGRGSREA